MNFIFIFIFILLTFCLDTKSNKKVKTGFICLISFYILLESANLHRRFAKKRKFLLRKFLNLRGNRSFAPDYIFGRASAKRNF